MQTIVRARCEVVARLRKAGAIILAKANMGEYASGDRSTFGGNDLQSL